MTEFIDIDVRPILKAGDEPFSTIMGALDRLQPGQGLRLYAPFKPLPLFGVMASKGLAERNDIAPARDRADDLVAAPGQLRPAASGLRVLTAVQGVRSGSVVLDRSGALVGLVAADAAQEKRVGDVAPIAARAMIPAAALGEFLGARRPKDTGRSAAPAGELSLGDIVAASRPAIVPIYCVP